MVVVFEGVYEEPIAEKNKKKREMKEEHAQVKVCSRVVWRSTSAVLQLDARC